MIFSQSRTLFSSINIRLISLFLSVAACIISTSASGQNNELSAIEDSVIKSTPHRQHLIILRLGAYLPRAKAAGQVLLLKEIRFLPTPM